MKSHSLSSQIFVLLLVASLFGGCAKKVVTRIDPNQQVDLSGRWNDTDSKLTAEAMMKDVLSRPWLTNFTKAKGKQPVVIVGIISNKTDEYIQPETFINDMQRELINSGMVRIVQNSVLREAMRKERGDQQQFSSPETAKKFGKELGADFMMFGTLINTPDQEGKRKLNVYQVDLTLADMETNELVWSGNKKIKKFITN
ncbi:MAG TPA: penicillin-binding protein activator LpoB [Catalimonadaceae bacterium]|nr:penicillin-binding protein activator LpoB [Catalimonadaceae bacterium]